MKFTKTEIDLCRQIAEKHRKKLCYGNWWVGKGASVFLMNIPHETLLPLQQHKDVIPLWTIEDCLRFLRAKGWIGQLSFVKNKASCRLYLPLNGHIWGKGRTPLEALLKAILAMLEEKK